MDERLGRVAQAWAAGAGVPADTPVEVEPGEPLPGGSQATALNRHRLSATTADGRWETEVVVKDTWRAELLALQALAGSRNRPEQFPLLIDGDLLPDPFGLPADHPLHASWVALPAYRGSGLPLRAPLPLDLAGALAWLHTTFLGRTSELDGVITIDGRWFRRGLIVDHLLPQWNTYADSEVAAEVRTWLTQLSEESVVDDALLRLPRTLLHGDVHGGNVIVSETGESVLIDWANARLGPPLVDLANGSELDSEPVRAYLLAFEQAAGPRPKRDIEAEFAYAQLQVNTQYLGSFLPPAEARAMVTRARLALDRLKNLV